MRNRAHALLSLARESPTRVAVHDRPGWLSLFANEAVVEDPVGSAPHRRQAGAAADPLSRFYDTFIGPNQVAMDTRLDVVHPKRQEVVRDVIIHTRLSTGLAVDVHAYLLYELIEEAGRLRIARLAAHWELPAMSLQVLGRGLPGLWTMNKITLHMLRIQGVGGVLGYLRGMIAGVFGRGRRTVAELAQALTAQDLAGVRALFQSDATIEVSESLAGPTGPSSSASPEPSPLSGGLERLTALLPTGYTWVVSSPLASGNTVAFRYALSAADGSPGAHGIGFCDFAAPQSLFSWGKKPRISRLRLFVSGDAPL
jgi:hypothetical protein